MEKSFIIYLFQLQVESYNLFTIRSIHKLNLQKNMPFSSSESLNYSFKTKKVSFTINIKHDKKCKEYLNVQA